MKLQYTLLSDSAKAPSYGSKGAIGLDLYAAEDGYVSPGAVTCIDTGVAVAIPEGYYGRIAPRSGLAAKIGVDVLAGVIDPDYRGEIKVLLTAHLDKAVYKFGRGEKIAQLILERAERAELVYVDALGATERGSGGFGSTGQ
jgi:dUTP pyrophosphatase